ncbi:MAG TPA: PQQ-dependent sugar dehydrogenase [Nitrososphaeraceae archaeon]|nr:PQQ-dependent sugar dehydrogenase [Nitrososphaeraceae archaeon]
MKKLFAISLLIFTIAIMLQNNLSYAQPSLKDPNLKVEAFVSGIASPTSMLFVDENNILVLEKDGNVRLVSNGMLQSQPLVSLSVDNKNERGLLGIEKIGENVFLYATVKDGQLINRIYKYTLAPGPELTNEQEFMDLPATPATNHQGGKLVASNDGYLYSVTGELQRNGKDQNIVNGPDPDFSGAILKTNANDGSPAPNNPFKSDNSNDPINWYQAYGLRNSFGLGIDPVTGALWDTENGENAFDEINLVSPGFNSGWKLTMGPISESGISQDVLVNFPDSNYKDPILSFRNSIGITDIEFLNSDKLGTEYANNAFVGDISYGNLYRFELNEDRVDFKFNDPGLEDRVVDNNKELDSVIFGEGFSGITDIKTGPDGLLYVLSFEDGTIYRISK